MPRRLVIASTEGVYGIQPCREALLSGASSLDAVEIGIRAVEDDHRARTVGYGGAPNMLGVVQTDASIMDGQTLRCGAVGALSGFRNPISVARAVMERLPHVFLVDQGANRFAAEIGAERAEMLSPEARECYEGWIRRAIPSDRLASWQDGALSQYLERAAMRNLSKGTVTFIVRDAEGRWGGGVSTSGWAYKYPGRLGDSPVIGAGLYVDGRFGGASCTHSGEMTIRAGTARAVVLYMKKGATAKEACLEAVDDLRSLQGGYLGPVFIHAVDRDGEICAVKIGETDGARYVVWGDGMAEPEVRELLAC